MIEQNYNKFWNKHLHNIRLNYFSSTRTVCVCSSTIEYFEIQLFIDPIKRHNSLHHRILV